MSKVPSLSSCPICKEITHCICEKYVFDVSEDDRDRLLIKHGYHAAIKCLRKVLEISAIVAT